MKLYAGVDLHSNNNYLGIMDQNDTGTLKRGIYLSEGRKTYKGFIKEAVVSCAAQDSS